MRLWCCARTILARRDGAHQRGTGAVRHAAGGCASHTSCPTPPANGETDSVPAHCPVCAHQSEISGQHALTHAHTSDAPVTLANRCVVAAPSAVVHCAAQGARTLAPRHRSSVAARARCGAAHVALTSPVPYQPGGTPDNVTHTRALCCVPVQCRGRGRAAGSAATTQPAAGGRSGGALQAAACV
jgi:hypothetical protein